MSEVIKLKRGLDIPLTGAAEKRVKRLDCAERYAVEPTWFSGLTPKLLVSEGCEVKAGTPLFFDKNRPQLQVTSPVSGVVAAIRRGEKRRLLAIEITTANNLEYEPIEVPDLKNASRQELVDVLLHSGLWTLIMQRPYGVIADPERTPKCVCISGFDTAPLAPDMNFVLKDERHNLQKGIDVLKAVSGATVHLGLKNGTDGVLNQLDGVQKHIFDGPHPAGNVGVQLHHIDPINKGEIVWTIDIQNVAVIGRLFNDKRVDMRKVIAITGSEVLEPQYVEVIAGAPVVQLAVAGGVKRQRTGDSFRIIIGNVLTGNRTDADGYLDFYHNHLTIIPEGNKYELFGWIAPRLKKFSVSHSYFSWLQKGKKYNLDTNLNGGRRALVVSGLYDKYLPMDIYPIYLLKACMAGDIDKMEELGIYEVLPEDFALCEFVDPSKTDMQAVIADGINLMIKELS